MKMTTSCSPMVGQYFDTVIVASFFHSFYRCRVTGDQLTGGQCFVVTHICNPRLWNTVQFFCSKKIDSRQLLEDSGVQRDRHYNERRRQNYHNNQPLPALNLIGHLHDPVTWYGINYTGTQIMQWDVQNKGIRTSPARLSFVLKVPLRNLRPSVIYSVPCDRIVQRAYCRVFKRQRDDNEISNPFPFYFFHSIRVSRHLRTVEFWNLNGFNSSILGKKLKTNGFLSIINKHDIFGLVETHATYETEKNISKFNHFIKCRNQSGNRSSGGLSVYINQKLAKEVTYTPSESKNIIWCCSVCQCSSTLPTPLLYIS